MAGRQNGTSEQDCERAVLRCVAGYRAEVRDLAATPLLARSYRRLDVDHLRRSTTDKPLQAEIRRAAARARRRTSDRALPKFTSEHAGQRRIAEDPPLITRVSHAEAEQLARGLDDYLDTLAPHWCRTLGGYTLVDIARKVFAGDPIDLTVPAFNVIWQRDANSYALRSLEHCTTPPHIWNITGAETLRVRDVADFFAARFGRACRFANSEGPTALLSDASAAHALLGPPSIAAPQLMEMVAAWVASGGATLNKPTQFERADGRF